MKQRGKIKTGIFLAVSAGILAVGIAGLFLHGPLGEYVCRRETTQMMAELGIFFLWCFGCLNGWNGKRGGRRAGILGLCAAILVFSWCHQVFWPMLVSGFYAAYLILLGGFFRRIFWGKNSAGEFDFSGENSHLGFDFVLGCSVWIVLVCALSALNLGGIPVLRAVAAATAVLLFCQAGKRLWDKRGRWAEWRETQCQNRASSIGKALLLALIFTMLALQMGRMNLTPDYDSLHYGLRSAYILDNGKGIYENLGNINLVYTYPKGLETLALPLSGAASYGYVLFFNLWITVGILAMTYVTARRLSGKRAGLLAAAAASCIPGIMNMSITAKSDSITLLIQLVMLYSFLCLSRQEKTEEKTKYFVISGCCYLLSLTMKPTAAVFSTVAWFSCFGWLIYKRKLRVSWNRYWNGAAVPALAWLGIWARTWMLTGIPLTSVFTSIWERLGFSVKEPFSFLALPDNGAGMSAAEGIRFFLERLLRILALPVGEDMAHVIIAWGTGLTPVFALILLLARRGKRGRTENTRNARNAENAGNTRNAEKTAGEKRTELSAGPLYAALLAVAAVSLVSLYLLWQVDGNYFMLLYALLAILGAAAFYRVAGKGIPKKMSAGVLALFFIFNAAVSCVTNWAGTSGFSPVSVVHAGYYDHREEAYREKSRLGNEAIWNILAADPAARTLAFGDHPGVLDFPCNIQSYYDVTGSGGNVYLVKKLDYFKGFLKWAKIQYLYVQAGYLEPGARAYDVVRFLIEDGSLADIRYESGNVLARVNLDGKLETSPLEAAEEFERLYPVKTGE